MPSAPAVCMTRRRSGTAASGEIAVAIPAASSGPMMKTSSSRRASNANAVSSRSRPTRLGSSVRSAGETGGTHEAAAEREHGQQRRARAGERRDHEADAGHRA